MVSVSKSVRCLHNFVSLPNLWQQSGASQPSKKRDSPQLTIKSLPTSNSISRFQQPWTGRLGKLSTSPTVHLTSLWRRVYDRRPSPPCSYPCYP